MLGGGLSVGFTFVGFGVKGSFGKRDSGACIDAIHTYASIRPDSEVLYWLSKNYNDARCRG